MSTPFFERFQKLKVSSLLNEHSHGHQCSWLLHGVAILLHYIVPEAVRSWIRPQIVYLHNSYSHCCCHILKGAEQSSMCSASWCGADACKRNDRTVHWSQEKLALGYQLTYSLQGRWRPYQCLPHTWKTCGVWTSQTCSRMDQAARPRYAGQSFMLALKARPHPHHILVRRRISVHDSSNIACRMLWSGSASMKGCWRKHGG